MDNIVVGKEVRFFALGLDEDEDYRDNFWTLKSRSPESCLCNPMYADKASDVASIISDCIIYWHCRLVFNNRVIMDDFSERREECGYYDEDEEEED